MQIKPRVLIISGIIGLAMWVGIGAAVVTIAQKWMD